MNVRDQRRGPDSLLNWFERLIQLRKELPEVGWGPCEVLETGNPAVLALRHNWEGRTLITAHNLKPRTAVATIEFDKPGGVTLRELFGQSDSIRARNGRTKIHLGPHEQRWLRLVG